MRIYTLLKSTFSLCHVIIGLCLIYMCYLNNFLMVTWKVMDYCYVCLYVQTEFFLRFQVAHLGIHIGQKSFEYLFNHFFVKPLKDINTSCCIYHVELKWVEPCIQWNEGKNYHPWQTNVWLSLWWYMWSFWTTMSSFKCCIHMYY